MYTLKDLLRKIKPVTETEAKLLQVIDKLARAVSLMQSQEKLWGPAHQVISEAKKVLEKPNDQG